MDYLSGKQEIQKAIIDHKTGKYVNTESTFTRFCDYVFSWLNPEEKTMLTDKFLTNEFINILKDKELVESINAFFKNNLNISETSRNAFLHRNTLLYRIDKIHKKTGLNVRKFDDALSFKLLSIIYAKKSYRAGKN